jgi:hypothetical protein
VNAGLAALCFTADSDSPQSLNRHSAPCIAAQSLTLLSYSSSSSSTRLMVLVRVVVVVVVAGAVIGGVCVPIGSANRTVRELAVVDGAAGEK